MMMIMYDDDDIKKWMNDDTNCSNGNTYNDDGIRVMIVNRVVINALMSVDGW